MIRLAQEAKLALTTPETARLESAQSAPLRVRRTPLYFQSQGAWLFGWLHRNEQASACTRGIILCPPVGFEQIHAHRGLRHLGDALAAAGFAVLRFDYHGTGDSAGSCEEADRHAIWLDNLRSAIRWVRQELGCAEISLAGLRLGAALATQIAAEEPIADLVLWAPVVKGHAYIREMRAIGSTAETPGEAQQEIEGAGFVLTAQTARDLVSIDLLQMQPRCRRALIVDRDDLPAENKLREHLRGLGIETQQISAPGYAELMAEPHHTKPPYDAIAAIVAWLGRGDVGGLPRRTVRESAWPTEVVQTGSLELPQSERALRLCAQPDLFGILSAPAGPAASAPELPVIVLLNAGSTYRAGPGRLYVLLARRLAAIGFRCLRLDLNGLGDSINPDPKRENETYPATAFRDINLTMQFLQRELGVRRIILMGLCAGAYFAFQSSAQFTDASLVESVLINPLTFYWREGMTLQAAPSRTFAAFRQSMVSARRPWKWLKLLTGRSRLGISGAIRNVLARWRLRRQVGPRRNEPLTASFPAHPSSNDLPGDLGRIAEKRRPLTLFLARSDPGYDILTFYARRQVDEMRRAGGLQIHFIEGADHTFTRRTPRQSLLDAIAGHLSRRYRRTPI